MNIFLRIFDQKAFLLKFALLRNDSGVWGDEAEGKDDGVVVLRSTEVRKDGSWSIDEPARRRLSPKDHRKGLLFARDLVVTTSSGSRDHIGKTALVTDEIAKDACAFSNFMQRLQLRPFNSPRFFFFLLNSHFVRRQMSYLGQTTTGLINLSGGILGNLRVPALSVATQTAIANFLDRKTTAIDALIEKKERLIELLAEKRAALIHRAVTKGLDPGVPMKDSGVPWIGEIPAHWGLLQLRYCLSRITYGFTSPMPTADDGPFMLTANDIQDGYIDYGSARRTEQGAMAALTAKCRPVAADVLLTKDGTLGRVAMADGRVSCINQSVALLRPDGRSLEGFFLVWLLRSRGYQEWMKFDAGGTTIKHIYITRVEKMRAVIPPKEEQTGISRYCEEMDIATRVCSKRIADQVERLWEYRQALITTVVTGQLDVPEASRSGPVADQADRGAVD